MVQQKTQDWGRGVGFLKTKCESSSHLGKLFPLVISGRRIGVCPCYWLGHKGLGWCLWHAWQAQEWWLHQIILVLLCCWQLPSCWAQHVTNGRKFILSHILALWVQHWEIDCTLKETPKDLNVQSSKCMNFFVPNFICFKPTLQWHSSGSNQAQCLIPKGLKKLHEIAKLLFFTQVRSSCVIVN